MCLAIPMKMLTMEADGSGIAEAGGIRRKVQLQLVPEVRVGDHVIVHTGFAVEILDEAEARARLALFEEFAAREEAGT